MKIFLSYENKTHEHLAREIALQLKINGCHVWFDKDYQRTFLRWLARPESDFGLDGWLRKGIYAANMLVVIVPYYRIPKGMPESWGPPLRPEKAKDITDEIGLQITRLYESFEGKASSKYNNPHTIDRALYYWVHPIHSFRIGWYEDHVGVPLGKDPFEQWRQWEMRVAGCIKLNILAIVPIEPEEDHLADSVSEILARRNFITVVRRSHISTDITDKVIPALVRRFPSKDEEHYTRQRVHKLKRMEIKLSFKIAFIIAGFITAMALIIKIVALLHLNIFLTSVIVFVIIIFLAIAFIFWFTF